MNLTLKSLAVSVVATILIAGTARAAEQSAAPGAAAAKSPPARAATSGAAKWKQPRTPWGDPDLQGTWPISHLMTVPLERPEKYGNRLEFTPDELAEQRKAAEAQNQRYKEE